MNSIFKKSLWLIAGLFVSTSLFADAPTPSAKIGGPYIYLENQTNYYVSVYDVKSSDFESCAFPKSSKFGAPANRTTRYKYDDSLRSYIGGDKCSKGSVKLVVNKAVMTDTSGKGNANLTVYVNIGSSGDQVSTSHTPNIDWDTRAGRPTTNEIRITAAWASDGWRIIVADEGVPSNYKPPSSGGSSGSGSGSSGSGGEYIWGN